jgi:hypothetical protein
MKKHLAFLYKIDELKAVFVAPESCKGKNLGSPLF